VYQYQLETNRKLVLGFLPKTKTVPKMKFHFRPETETKTKTARHLRPKTKLSCSRNNTRQISSVLLCEYANDAAQI